MADVMSSKDFSDNASQVSICREQSSGDNPVIQVKTSSNTISDDQYGIFFLCRRTSIRYFIWMR